MGAEHQENSFHATIFRTLRAMRFKILQRPRGFTLSPGAELPRFAKARKISRLLFLSIMLLTRPSSKAVSEGATA